jgi:hypothetical protein
LHAQLGEGFAGRAGEPVFRRAFGRISALVTAGLVLSTGIAAVQTTVKWLHIEANPAPAASSVPRPQRAQVSSATHALHPRGLVVVIHVCRPSPWKSDRLAPERQFLTASHSILVIPERMEKRDAGTDGAP